MLTCPKCQIDYEEGKKFCKKCGSPLESKREIPGLEGSEKGPEVILSCPACKLEYESGKFCKKCGSPLVEQAPSKKHEPEAPPTEVKKEVSKTEIPQKPPVEEGQKQLVCPNCKASYETGKFCKKCGLPLIGKISLPKKEEVEQTVTPEVKREDERAENFPKKEDIEVTQVAGEKEEPTPSEVTEKPSTEKIRAEEGESAPLSEVREKLLKPLSITIAGIIILIAIGGFFLWPKYSHLLKKKPSATEQVSKESVPPTPIPEASTPSAANAESKEFIAIKTMLENIRQANLQKNIDLFMSCYSPEFKDLEGRKKGTLDNWEKFDYSDLSYDLRSQAMSGDTANIRVEWTVTYSRKGGGQKQQTKSLLDVTLKKENGVWKIQDSQSAN